MKQKIEDSAIRQAIDDINKRIDAIERIPQVSKDATLSQLINIVNKIIAKDKRR